jgi:cyclic pyranopterin phosphate synthase
MRDAFGREIEYLRVSVTDRCNLRCVYCMPEEGIRLIPHAHILSFEQIESIARAAVGLGMVKIRLTGGEPLVRKDLTHLVAMLGAIPGLKILAMTTNGTLLEPLAAALAASGLHSVNISVDTLDPERYRRITRGGDVRAALAGARAALACGLEVKFNMVVMDDTSREEIDALRDLADSMGAKMQTISRYSLQEDKRDGGEFDRPPPCGQCNRIRLLADGTLRSCLHSDIGIPVNFDDIAGSLRAAVLGKPNHGGVSSTLSVGQIGG